MDASSACRLLPSRAARGHVQLTGARPANLLGGQAVNKASNAVNLLHSPSGIRVRCHMSRSLELNRREARRMLLAQLDDQVNGEASKGSIAALKERERKRTRGRKSARKHGGDDAAPPAS